jgi:DNA-binding FadR family transcriptional regulator
MTTSIESTDVLHGSRLSRAEALARELEDEISAGVLGTGDKLGTKDELRQRFNVAAATINEAIKLLGNRGMVEARPGPGGGVFVAGPSSRIRSGPMIMGFRWSEATIADYHEVRSALEPLICVQAARNRQGSDIRALKTILATMESHLDRPLDYARLNTAFHRRIAKLSTNAPLRSLYLTLLDFYETDLHGQQLPPVVASENISVHQQLLDAIEEGEGPALDEAMRRHDEHRASLGMFRPDPPGTPPAR